MTSSGGGPSSATEVRRKIVRMPDRRAPNTSSYSRSPTNTA